MTQPHVKKGFRWLAMVAVMYGVSTGWKLPLLSFASFISSSQLGSRRATQLDSGPAILVGSGAYGRMMRPQSAMKAFLKDVVFGGMAADPIVFFAFGG